MKNLISICLFVTLAMMETQGQMGPGMQMIFQEMGVELPPMPPSMPQSLRDHLYPQQKLRRQQQQIQRQVQWRLQLQRQRQLAAAQAAALQQSPPNPYSVSYRQSRAPANSKQINTVYSPANMIRSPTLSPQTVKDKVNPYSVSRASKMNPYSKTRYPGSRSSRPTAAPSLSPPVILSTIRQARQQSKKIVDATAAGCTLPFEATATINGMVLGTCKNPGARMVCQSKMLACSDVGMVAMCCPYPLHSPLARDTLSYVKKLQTFVAEVA